MRKEKQKGYIYWSLCLYLWCSEKILHLLVLRDGHVEWGALNFLHGGIKSTYHLFGMNKMWDPGDVKGNSKIPVVLFWTSILCCCCFQVEDSTYVKPFSGTKVRSRFSPSLSCKIKLLKLHKEQHISILMI